MIDQYISVDIFFRLINFALIVGLLYFLFKKFLLNAIKAAMAAQKHLLISLSKSVRTAHRKHQLMNRELQHDSDVQGILKQKIMRWRASVEKENEKITEMAEQRSCSLDTQIRIQIAHVQKEMLFKRALPDALGQARSQLYAQFQNETKQGAYIEQIIGKIKSEKSP